MCLLGVCRMTLLLLLLSSSLLRTNNYSRACTSNKYRLSVFPRQIDPRSDALHSSRSATSFSVSSLCSALYTAYFPAPIPLIKYITSSNNSFASASLDGICFHIARAMILLDPNACGESLPSYSCSQRITGTSVSSASAYFPCCSSREERLCKCERFVLSFL
jgi:hypothetical protein